MIHFQDMKYTRPDVSALREKAEELGKQLENASSFDEVERLFFAFQDLSSDASTDVTLCSIRHGIDTRDEFYDKEMEYLNSVTPEMQEIELKFMRRLMQSPFRSAFEEKYGNLIFVNQELADKSFSPAILEDLAKENELTTAYEKLLASAQIPFEDGIYTLSQLTPFKQDPDDERRRKAWIAEGNFYNENGEKLDELYDQLVKLRDSMGRKLGYDGYETMGYCRMQRNCYGRKEIEAFRAAVRTYIVPLADKLYRNQAKRMGFSYPLSFADAGLTFRSGNAKPQGGPEDVLAAGKKFYHELSPETSRFIDEMMEYGLMDVLSRPGKQGGGYCTDLGRYRMPFIFANFNGTAGDVEVITHEAGHAFEAWTARTQPILSYCWPSMEACEVHSMSMEFFAEAWAEDFFGKDAKKFRYTHLADAIEFIPYGTLVDHFQHEVYDHPEMTPAQRHETWKRLLGVYMPWLRLDGEIPFYAEGKGWQRQHHIYSSPYYYIDYCLAQTMALYFWSLIQSDRDHAWKEYMRYTEQAGTKTFTELLKHAGLPSPFDEIVLRKVSGDAGAFLENYDLSGI